MDEVVEMKNLAKKYLDNADEKTVKMVFAMLQVDAEKDWWDELPGEVKKSIKRGLDGIEKGRLTPHNEVIKRYNNIY